MTDRIHNLHEMWIAAYAAGYRDGAGERNADPGDSMPDDMPEGLEFRPFDLDSMTPSPYPRRSGVLS